MGSIWTKRIPPGGGHVLVTTCETIRLVNACLGFSQNLSAAGRGILLFGEDEDRLVAISAFQRGSVEHDRLQIELEVGRTYIFSVFGPFSIDIVGYTLPTQFLFRCPSGGAYRSWACLSASYLSRCSSDGPRKAKGVRKRREVLSPLELVNLEGRGNGGTADANDFEIAPPHTEGIASLEKARVPVSEPTTLGVKSGGVLTKAIVGEPAKLHSPDALKEVAVETKNPKDAKTAKDAIIPTGSKNTERKKPVKEIPVKVPKLARSAKAVRDDSTVIGTYKVGTRGVVAKRSMLQPPGNAVEELVGESKAKGASPTPVGPWATMAKEGAAQDPAMAAEKEKAPETTGDNSFIPVTGNTTRKVGGKGATVKGTTLQASKHGMKEVEAGSHMKTGKDVIAPGVATRRTSVQEVRAVGEPKTRVKGGGKGARTAKNAVTVPVTGNAVRQVGEKGATEVEETAPRVPEELAGGLASEVPPAKVAGGSTVSAGPQATTRGMRAKELAAEPSGWKGREKENKITQGNPLIPKTRSATRLLGAKGEKTPQESKGTTKLKVVSEPIAKGPMITTTSRAITRGNDAGEVPIEEPLQQQQLAGVGKQTRAKVKTVNATNHTLAATDSRSVKARTMSKRCAVPTTRMTRRMAAAASEGTGGDTSVRGPSATHESDISQAGPASKLETDADVVGPQQGAVVEANIRWKINLAKRTINIVKRPAEPSVGK